MKREIQNEDLIFVCGQCGPHVESGGELKCCRCGKDCVIKRAVLFRGGVVEYKPLRKGRRS